MKHFSHQFQNPVSTSFVFRRTQAERQEARAERKERREERREKLRQFFGIEKKEKQNLQKEILSGLTKSQKNNPKYNYEAVKKHLPTDFDAPTTLTEVMEKDVYENGNEKNEKQPEPTLEEKIIEAEMDVRNAVSPGAEFVAQGKLINLKWMQELESMSSAEKAKSFLQTVAIAKYVAQSTDEGVNLFRRRAIINDLQERFDYAKNQGLLSLHDPESSKPMADMVADVEKKLKEKEVHNEDLLSS